VISLNRRLKKTFNLLVLKSWINIWFLMT